MDMSDQRMFYRAKLRQRVKNLNETQTFSRHQIEGKVHPVRCFSPGGRREGEGLK